MKLAAGSFSLCITILTAFAQLPEDLKRKFDEAERRIVRLSPTSFPELPNKVVRELQRRGCTIPQTPYTKKPQNVVKGEYAKPGQIDWAVLCSINQTPWLFSFWSDPHYVSSILVFWNGSEKNPAELAPQADRDYLQGISANEIGFSRIIGTARREFIIQHNRSTAYQDVNHHGIDDSFAEKGSTTWYFHDGKWTKMLGAD